MKRRGRGDRCFFFFLMVALDQLQMTLEVTLEQGIASDKRTERRRNWAGQSLEHG